MMNLNRIDLNLFVVLDAIYTAGSLTKAGEVLCITQPAVSNSLSRLREIFNDPLFVRTGQTMTPTPVAQNIIGPARDALSLLRKSVQDCHVFDPSVAEKTFKFSMRDLFEVAIFPRLMQRLEQMAPHISLQNYLIPREDVVSAMASGNLDFYADASLFTDPHLCKQMITQDRFVLMARRNHPLLHQGLTMETFMKLRHINISQRQSGAGHVDIALGKLGLKRNVLIRGQNFLTVPSLMAKTDMVACLPYHLAKHFDMEIFELPFETPNLEYFVYWHISADQDQAHHWVREQILEATKTFRGH